mgnify:FL=1
MVFMSNLCNFVYDLHRLVIQGVCKNTPTDCMSAVVNYSSNGGICNSGYSYTASSCGVELVSHEMETVNYYDKYNFFNGPLFHIYNNGYLRQMCLSPTSGAAGLLTGSVTNSTDSVQLYNGNEFDHSLKLALYNYGARHIFSKLILIPA